MSILEKIIADKRKEVDRQKELVPLDTLEKSSYLESKGISLVSGLGARSSSGIIAEYKRKSPSAGVMNEGVDPEPIARAYAEAGAAGMSILTDRKYFGGTIVDLDRVRRVSELPILRKEFIIDEYQVLESRASGADVILLIAAVLNRNQVQQFAGLAKTLGMEVILEIHEEKELDRLHNSVDIIGVNNRDLKRMITDVETSRQLASKIPSEFVKVSESGISNAETIVELKEYGFLGFLIGEHFMQHKDPGIECRRLIKKLRS
jgi:indole-3-glycerol phosphate synthase